VAFESKGIEEEELAARVEALSGAPPMAELREAAAWLREAAEAPEAARREAAIRRLDDADADGNRVPQDDLVELFPFPGRKFFGIGDGDALQQGVPLFISHRQNHGGGNHRSRQWTATRLVDPGHKPVTAPLGLAFEAVHPSCPPRLQSQPCGKTFEFLPKPGKSSFLRKQESSPFKTFWIPAFAGMTTWGIFQRSHSVIPGRRQDLPASLILACLPLRLRR